MEAPHSGYLGRMKVLHPPQLVTTAEPILPALSGLKGRHHSQSTGGGELGVKEQKNAYKLQSCIPCHHPSSLNWYKTLHCPLASQGGSLLMEGSLTHSHCQSIHGAYATRDTGGTCNSYNVH